MTPPQPPSAVFSSAAVATEQAGSPVIFDALLTPHRSLSPRGFGILMAAIGSMTTLIGVGFFLLGAWPVFGFMGLDVLLLYLAFRVNYARARTFETLELTRDDLFVRRVTHRGVETRWRFQPYWLRVEMAEPARPDTPLLLISHGRALAIGAFLSPHERLDLAKALQRALQQLRSTSVAGQGVSP